MHNLQWFLDRFTFLFKYNKKADEFLKVYLEYFSDFPFPYVYNYEEIFVRFEWDIKDYALSFDFNLNDSIVHLHNLNLGDYEDDYYELSLDSEDDVEFLCCYMFTLLESI